jgi:hypothetical protein
MLAGVYDVKTVEQIRALRAAVDQKRVSPLIILVSVDVSYCEGEALNPPKVTRDGLQVHTKP